MLRCRSLSLIFLALLVLMQAAAAGAQAGGLQPHPRDPLPLPREVELTLRCLTAERSINVFNKSRFGFAPLPVLPDAGLRGRVLATIAALTSAATASAPPAIEPPTSVGLEKEALRASLAPAATRSRTALSHLELIRGQIRLLRASRDDSVNLGKLRAAQLIADTQPGPTLDEFATLATIRGDPAPCEDPRVARSRGPRKLALEAKFAAFRFGDELYRVLSTLDETGAVRTKIPEADAGTCGLKPATCDDTRPEVVLLPYWLGRGKLPPVAGQPHPIDAFHDALADADAALGAAALRFRSRFVEDGTALLPQAKTLRNQLRNEHDQLATWQQQLDAEAAALAALRTEIAQQRSRVSAIDAALPAKEGTIAALKSDLAAARTERDALAVSATAKRADLANLRAAIASLVIDCGGAIYAKCSDAAAKLDYDRKRYELYEKLESATSELFDLQTQQQALVLRMSELQEKMAKNQAERQYLIAERAECRVYITRTIPELNSRHAKWETDSARAASLAMQNGADLGVLDALVALASAEP